MRSKYSIYKKEKFISALLTLGIMFFTLLFLFTCKVSFPVENEKSNVETAYDPNFEDRFHIEGISSLEPEIELVESVQIPADSTTNKDEGIPEKKTEKITVTEKPKVTEKSTETSKPKSKGRILLSAVPGTLKRGGKLPNHNCKGKGNITFYYTADKNGSVIKVWKKTGAVNSCLEKTGAGWIKKYVKIDKGEKNWTGTYTLSFK